MTLPLLLEADGSTLGWVGVQGVSHGEPFVSDALVLAAADC